jgi:C1A family cysteine protease
MKKYKNWRLTLEKDEKDKRDFKLSSAMEVSLETGVNYIDWYKYMSPVKDQGRLGSCVGFAVAAMKEFQEYTEHMAEVKAGKKYTRKHDQYDLSEAWIYWNSKKIDPWPNQEGTSIRCAMKVLHRIGVPCEAGWKYDDRFKGEPESWASLVAKWGLIDSYYRISSVDELRTALQVGPVVIGIGCFEEIFKPNFETGVVSYPANPSNLLGGHAICAVGYSDNTKMIKFKNSWGTQWGKKGYGFLSYRYINDFMWDAWVAKDLNVTRKILKERAKTKL